MIFLVVGLPGRFAEWCDRATVELARGTGPAELVCANSLEEIALGAIASGTARAIVAARQPDGGLRSAVAASGRNFVLALDDPRQLLTELVLLRDMPLAAAVSFLASSCAATLGCAAMPGALPLWRERAWVEPSGAAAAIAHHLQLPASEAQIAAIGRVEMDAGVVSPEEALAWWNGLDADSRDLVEGALGPYLRQLATGELGAISWASDLFFLGDRPEERASGAIDITGRARCLLQGPHMLLPAGSWSLTVVLLFSRETVEHEFAVEVVTDHQLASGTIRPQREGRVEVNLNFVLPELADQPVSLRVSTQRAAFDGTVTLVSAILTRPGEPAAGAPPAATPPAAV